MLGKKLRVELPYYKLLVFSALLPDIDIFLIFFGWQYLGWHAIYTHTLLGILGLGIPVLLAFRFLYRVDLAKAIPYYLLGFGSHLFLDIFNWRYAIGYSQRFLWPFSTQTYNFFYLLGIPSRDPFALAVYLSIFSLTVIVIAYSIWKKNYPWAIWQEEFRRIEKIIKK